MEQGIEKHICRRGDFQPFLPWSRMPQIQAIRMVYVTARLSFTAILAHYVSILPFLCSPFTRLQIVQISRDFEEEMTSILVTLSF